MIEVETEQSAEFAYYKAEILNLEISNQFARKGPYLIGIDSRESPFALDSISKPAVSSPHHIYDRIFSNT